jgi:sporulation protein YlmC with PRC-barrel domain
VNLPEQLLLSDLLRRRVRCQAGIDHGPGVMAWMHPPVHRLLGWISKPSAFGDRRQAWRLDQLRGLAELEALVQGQGSDTDSATAERLPTLIEAAVLDRRGEPIGSLADAAVELSSGRILHYLVSRSDPRLPGSSRWRLSPDRIVDQQLGQVSTGLSSLDELPLARASVRQEFLRRSRRWRDQVQEETSRLRDQFQQAGDRFEERLEGWLEDPDPDPFDDRYREPEPRRPRPSEPPAEAWDDWDGWEDGGPEDPIEPPPPAGRRRQAPDDEDDPWI